MTNRRFLRAQFRLREEPFIPIDYGDILEVLGKDEDENLKVIKVPSGEDGIAPRTTAAFYVDVNPADVGYTQPLILVGCLSRYIQDMLLHRQPQMYTTPLPHTTRLKRLHERDGVHYSFVKKNTMEQMMSNGLFVDCFESNGCLYGVSEAAIRTVAQKQKKHAILESTTAVPRLLHRNIHPIVLFVATRNWNRLHDVTMFDGASESDSRKQFEQSEEELVNHTAYIHKVIRESSLEESFEKVLSTMQSLREQAWIPRVGDTSQRLI